MDDLFGGLGVAEWTATKAVKQPEVGDRVALKSEPEKHWRLVVQIDDQVLTLHGQGQITKAHLDDVAAVMTAACYHSLSQDQKLAVDRAGVLPGINPELFGTLLSAIPSTQPGTGSFAPIQIRIGENGGELLYWASPEFDNNAIIPTNPIIPDPKLPYAATNSNPSGYLKYEALPAHETVKGTTETRGRIRRLLDRLRGAPWADHAQAAIGRLEAAGYTLDHTKNGEPKVEVGDTATNPDTHWVATDKAQETSLPLPTPPAASTPGVDIGAITAVNVQQPAAQTAGTVDLFSHITTSRQAAPETITVSVESPTIPRPTPEQTAASDPSVEKSGVALQWRPSGETLLGPTGERARVAANLAALEVLASLDEQGRYATADEQIVLSKWSSWGATKRIFEQWRPEWEADNQRLRQALTAKEYEEAKDTVLTAFYTDPRIAKAMWDALSAYGIDGNPKAVEIKETGKKSHTETRYHTVLEPGAGAGVFQALAPHGVQMVGVEVDSVTARINAALNPTSHIINADMAKHRLGGIEPVFDAVIGNIPYGGFALHDRLDNPDSFSVHNHFIAKSLAHTRPEGIVMVLTSAWTMDSHNSKARSRFAELGTLEGAVRLPTGALKDAAGTDVLIDCLIFRKYPQNGTRDYAPEWLHTVALDDEVDADGHPTHTINQYFMAHPENVLGGIGWGTDQYGKPAMEVKNDLDGDEIGRLLNQRLSVILKPANAALPGATPPWFQPGLHVPSNATGTADGQMRVNDTGELQQWSVDGERWNNVVPVKANATKGILAFARRVPQTRALLRLRDAVQAVMATQDSFAPKPDEAKLARENLNKVYDQYVAKYGPVAQPFISKQKPTKAEQNRRMRDMETLWRSELPDELDSDERADFTIPAEVKAGWEKEAREPYDIPILSHLVDLEDDPAYPLLLALETTDSGGETFKSEIFTRDIGARYVAPTSAETPQDALAISLSPYGSVDLEKVTQLLNLPNTEAALSALDGLVFRGPVTGNVQPTYLYLSGDVRTKLEEAKKAAETDPTYQANVTALEQVIPDTVEFANIFLRPGMKFLGTQTHQQFIADTFAVPAQVSRSDLDDSWHITGISKSALKASTISLFGTSRRHPGELLEDTMNNKPTIVHDNLGTKKDPHWVVNQEQTAAAREKQAAIEVAFSSWAASKPDLAKEIETKYNRLLNSYVTPNFSTAAESLTLPGKSDRMQPNWWQSEGVVHIYQSRTTLLDHVVGAGKTGVMVMAAMKMRQLGISEQPWIVVPNHLVASVSAEFLTWYPGGKIMTIPTGAERNTISRLLTRSMVSDLDAVIVGQSTFNRIGLSQARTSLWLREETAKLDDLLRFDDGKSKQYVAKVQRAKKAITKKFDKMQEKGQEFPIGFEQLKCDFLFVDEAHHYKNLERHSATPDLDYTPGSERARDMEYKLRALSEKRIEQNHPSAPYVCMATGTPVANALEEHWVMMKYLLAPELMKQLGVDTVDGWARMFAASKPKLQLGVDGRTMQLKNKVCEFMNLPELFRISDIYTHTVTREVLADKLPKMVGGIREQLLLPLPASVKHYIDHLVNRANKTPDAHSEGLDLTDSHIDNSLKIMSDGTKAALYAGLAKYLDGTPVEVDPGETRVTIAADKIMAVAEATASTRYLTGAAKIRLKEAQADGLTYEITDADYSPVLGSLQVAFCDQSTPKYDGNWNFYDALTAELVARGMPRNQIAYIHDVNNDAERLELFRKANAGHIRLLIGSTEKMGTGMNVQERLAHIHHIDCPWRPADIEQREGRGIRQGNQNAEVGVSVYFTERTLDSLRWDKVAGKASFLAQLKKSGARTVEVGDDLEISGTLIAAAAAGDPRLTRRATLIGEVARLEALETGWKTMRTTLKHEAATRTGEADRFQKQADALQAVATRLISTQGNRFLFTTPNGDQIGERFPAGAWLLKLAQTTLNDHPTQTLTGQGVTIPACRLGGLDLELNIARRDHTNLHRAQIRVAIPGSEHTVATEIEIKAGNTDPRQALGIISSLESQMRNLPSKLDAIQAAAKVSQTRAAEAQQIADAEAAATFPDAALLTKAKGELATLNSELEAETQTETPPADDHIFGLSLAQTFGETTEPHDGHNIPNDQVRVGDIVMLAGKPEQWVWHGDTDWGAGGEKLVVNIDDSKDTRTLNGEFNLQLVARLRSSLTAIEAAASDAGPKDELVAPHNQSKLSTGDRITLIGYPAEYLKTHEAVTGKHWDNYPAWDEYQAKPDTEPYKITGTLTELLYDHTNYGTSYTALRIETDDGETHLIQPENNSQKLFAIRHALTVTQSDEADIGRELFATMLPGDKATGVTGNPNLPGTLTMTMQNNYYGSRRRYVSDTGKEIDPYEIRKAECAQIIPGRYLTPNEAIRTFGENWNTPQAAQLRAGDRARIGDIDPKAKGNTNSAVITNVANERGRTITYRGEDTGLEATVTRKATAEIPIQSRRFGALTPLEQRLALGATKIYAGYIEEQTALPEIGDKVWFTDKETTATGIVTDTNDRGYYGSKGDDKYGSFTFIEDNTGKPHTFYPAAAAHKRGDAAIYPADAQIPERIDPTQGTPIYPANHTPAQEIPIINPTVGAATNTTSAYHNDLATSPHSYEPSPTSVGAARDWEL